MLTSVLTFIGRFAIGGKVLDGIHAVNQKLSGNRTEILVGLEALIYLLEKVGIITADLVGPANALATALLGAIPITLAQKISAVQSNVDAVAPTPAAPAQ